MKQHKNEIVQEIEKAELYKEKLQEKLRNIEIEIDKIDNSLEEKRIIYGVYDKIIKDSDNAYMTVSWILLNILNRLLRVLKLYIKW